MTLDEAFELFFRLGNVGCSLDELKKNPPYLYQLHAAAMEIFRRDQSQDPNIIYQAQKLIRDHFYPTSMQYSRDYAIDPAMIYAYDTEKGVYGEAELKRHEAEAYAAFDLITNPKPIPPIDDKFDWKELCLRILNRIGKAEGVWYEDYWQVSSMQRMQVNQAYKQWEGPPPDHPK